MHQLLRKQPSPIGLCVLCSIDRFIIDVVTVLATTAGLGMQVRLRATTDDALKQGDFASFKHLAQDHQRMLVRASVLQSTHNLWEGK